MRILLVPSTYHPVLGGVQTVTHNLAQSLLKKGHEVKVVTNRYPRSLPAQEIMDGVAVRRLLFLSRDITSLQRGRADLFLASFFFYPSSLRRLENLMRTFRPEVVNVHFPDHQIHFVLALRRRFQFRLIVSLHGHEVERVSPINSDNNRKDPTHSAVQGLQLILREADAVTACSQDLLDKAIALDPSITAKAKVIHNGIDPKRFIDKSPHFHPRPYALSFGRLTHKKGFDLLVKAFAQVGAVEWGIDLIIAGKGEERNALAQQVQQLGLEGRVHFPGQASPEEVVRLLNGCQFVVVPSRYEPFGIVALETLAAGKPLLATKIGGLAEFLSEFSGPEVRSEWGAQLLPKCRNSSTAPKPPVVLVDSTAEELAKGLRQIRELSRDDSNELGGYRLSDKYSWEHVASCYENVLVGRVN